MAEPIESFRGDYRFLSNFYPSPFEFTMLDRSWTAPTVEHGFQAAKVLVAELDRETTERWAEQIMSAQSPASAKALGRKIPNLDLAAWERIAPGVMLSLLRRKFENPDLRRRLLLTGDRALVEGNTWGDTLWGVDARTGEGQNLLGQALMTVRVEVGGGRALSLSEAAYTVSCPRCEAKKGEPCVYLPQQPDRSYTRSAAWQAREALNGTPTKRPHAERTARYSANARAKRERERARLRQEEDRKYPSEAVFAVRAFDVAEYEQMRRFLRTSHEILGLRRVN